LAWEENPSGGFLWASGQEQIESAFHTGENGNDEKKKDTNRPVPQRQNSGAELRLENGGIFSQLKIVFGEGCAVEKAEQNSVRLLASGVRPKGFQIREHSVITGRTLMVWSLGF
jgi:hypothetical protein